MLQMLRIYYVWQPKQDLANSQKYMLDNWSTTSNVVRKEVKEDIEDLQK